MPPEPKYGLPAHTAMAGALRIGRFAKRGWWHPKTDPWPRFLDADSPHPSFRRAAKCSERAGEFIGPNRVVAPIRIDGPSRRCREEWPAERMYQDGRRKDFRQIAHEARPRLFISLSSPRGYSHGSATLACYRKELPGKALRNRSWPWPCSWADRECREFSRCVESVELLAPSLKRPSGLRAFLFTPEML
jgi:hypothetical protein